MKLAVRNGGAAARSATRVHVRSGGVTKQAERAWLRTGGVLKQFIAALQVALSSYSVIGRGNSASVVTVTSSAVTATVTGAIGTVSYAWTRTDTDPQAWTINSPTSATTTFSTVCDQGESFDATFICTATDQAGQVLASDEVSVSCANIYYGGGYVGSGGTHGTAFP